MESWTSTGSLVRGFMLEKESVLSHFSPLSQTRRCVADDTGLCPAGWLDDIGLPQYKTQFDEGRVDGRMLHYMTVVSSSAGASSGQWVVQYGSWYHLGTV